jgi:hypothetical protein
MKKALLLATALVCGSVLAANAQATRNPTGSETGPTVQRSSQGRPDVQGQSTAPRAAMTTGKKKAKKKSKKRM